MSIQIQRIKPEQIAEAKRVILLVARGIYQWPETLEQIIQKFDEQGKLQDIDDVQATYFDRRGLFLVAIDQGRIIGTGAIRQIDAENAELKRMWLLDAYHGRGIGYRLVRELFCFARNEGYQRVRL